MEHAHRTRAMFFRILDPCLYMRGCVCAEPRATQSGSGHTYARPYRPGQERLLNFIAFGRFLPHCLYLHQHLP